MKRYFIIRHAEAVKTLHQVHGGKGTPLTEQGKQDIIRLTEFMVSKWPDIPHKSLVCSSLVPQVFETGKKLSLNLRVQFLRFENLCNINMGVLDGLSDDDAWVKYPEEMQRLTSWRQGKLRVEDIRIPNAEPLPQFLERIGQVIKEITARDAQNFIFIVTRSVGIAILNILLQGSHLSGKPYTRFRLDPCSLTLVTAAEIGSGELVLLNQSHFLGRTMDYPDD